MMINFILAFHKITFISYKRGCCILIMTLLIFGAFCLFCLYIYLFISTVLRVSIVVLLTSLIRAME